MGENELIYERVNNLNIGQHRVYCPVCHSSRKKHNQNQKELAVKIDNENIQYYCHHCDISGGFKINSVYSKPDQISHVKAQDKMREIDLENYKHTETDQDVCP